jgi:hypothetical protein
MVKYGRFCSGRKRLSFVKGRRHVRIPTHPAGRSDNIRSVIPEYPVT